MSTNNICLYKEVDKKYTCCILKTTELLDCVLIGVCAVIRSNTVFIQMPFKIVPYNILLFFFSEKIWLDIYNVTTEHSYLRLSALADYA